MNRNHLLPGLYSPKWTLSENSKWRELFGLFFLAGGYLLTVRAGLLLVAPLENVASIWPASGVALGALLVSGKSRRVSIISVIFITNALGNWFGGSSIAVSLGFALANAFEAALGAWVLDRIVEPRITFERAKEILALLFIATACNGISALIGAAVSTLAFGSPYSLTWMVWWAADGLGILMVTPVIVTWYYARKADFYAYLKRLPEIILLMSILIAFAEVLFGPYTAAERPILRNYMLFPLLIWMAFRFNTRDTANALVIYSTIAIWNTLQGRGIFGFASQARTENLIALQIYLSVASFSGLLLSAMVSERRRDQESLQDSRRQLDQAQELAHTGHWIWDVDAHAVEWSDEIYRIFGAEPRSFPPSMEAFEATIHPEDLQPYLACRAKMLAEKKETFIEHRIILPDGFVRHVEERTQIETDLAGAVRRVIGTVQDITERKRMEEALRESEEKYRMVANFTYDWEAWHAPYGAYLYVSPACKRVTGYTPEEFLRDPNLIVHITHPEDRANIVEHFRATTDYSKERDVAFDFRIITKDGETRWINHSCIAVYGADGKWLGRRESNRDITARKQSEAALRSRLHLGQYADKHSVDDVMQYVLNEVEALTESQIAFFHLLTPDQNTITLQMWSANTLQNACSAEAKNHQYRLEQAGIWVDCIRKRQAVIYNDYDSAPGRKGLPEGHAPIKRILTVPIFHNDLIVAIVGVGNKLEDYDYQDIKIVSQIADLAWDVILRKRSEEEARRTKEALEIANGELQIALAREKELSRTDPLTGVHNRRHLFELAEREFDIGIRHRMPLSVIMFDIDFFKKVNDTFGHDVGDQVLQRVTEAARAELRSSDIIGRYGGEEFVVILPMTSAQQAFPVAERIRARIEALRVPTSKGEAKATLSIGIAELRYELSENAVVDDLIRRADEAMYIAKQAGRNRISIYKRD